MENSGINKPINMNFTDDQKQIINELKWNNINIFPFNVPKEIFDIFDGEYDVHDSHWDKVRKSNSDKSSDDHIDNCLLCTQFKYNIHCRKWIGDMIRNLEYHCSELDKANFKLFKYKADFVNNYHKISMCYDHIRELRLEISSSIYTILDEYIIAKNGHQILLDINAKI